MHDMTAEEGESWARMETLLASGHLSARRYQVKYRKGTTRPDDILLLSLITSPRLVIIAVLSILLLALCVESDLFTCL
jgi:hypothetical protein